VQVAKTISTPMALAVDRFMNPSCFVKSCQPSSAQ
jgi:hypothetical protein